MRKYASKISIVCGGESPLGIELVATNARIFLVENSVCSPLFQKRGWG